MTASHNKFVLAATETLSEEAADAARIHTVSTLAPATFRPESYTCLPSPDVNERLVAVFNFNLYCVAGSKIVEICENAEEISPRDRWGNFCKFSHGREVIIEMKKGSLTLKVI